ncbi:Crp/Fnr family transcriptional regulator [Fulvivirga lutea]|uniref:Crp/Fnr family transcriptional regulator n=1 Tax=Fulvivirga lutea TaxID=2810512 RepID=A0A974WHJ9_9BACT|nr:Crp/Fnr family transcriptional regulator [Fulvivirga lutea]QSE98668.1 Crp/Fnr family transcriptional regulator [Fulvivirga lutea]
MNSLNHSKDLYNVVVENFHEILKLQRFKKGDIVHSEGKICHNLYFVRLGILRAYYFKEDKDITAHFAFQKESITAPDAFILNKPSKYSIEALEDSEVFSVNNIELENYLDQNPDLERLARKFTQAIYLELLERLEGLVFLSAKERYEALLIRNSQLPLNVNLGHIASYLGITQETLSRIRAQ